MPQTIIMIFGIDINYLLGPLMVLGGIVTCVKVALFIQWYRRYLGLDKKK